MTAPPADDMSKRPVPEPSAQRGEAGDGDDPYKDIELYLERAQEEIGQTFQNPRNESHSNAQAEQTNATGEERKEKEEETAGEEEARKKAGINDDSEKNLNGLKKLVRLEAILHGLSVDGRDGDRPVKESGGDGDSSVTNPARRRAKKKKKNVVGCYAQADDGISVASRIAQLCNLPPLKQVESSAEARSDLIQADDYYYGAHLMSVISAGLTSNARRNRTQQQYPPKNADGGSHSLPTKLEALRPASSNMDLNALSSWANSLALEMATMANENGEKASVSDDNNNFETSHRDRTRSEELESVPTSYSEVRPLDVEVEIFDDILDIIEREELRFQLKQCSQPFKVEVPPKGKVDARGPKCSEAVMGGGAPPRVVGVVRKSVTESGDLDEDVLQQEGSAAAAAATTQTTKEEERRTTFEGRTEDTPELLRGETQAREEYKQSDVCSGKPVETKVGGSLISKPPSISLSTSPLSPSPLKPVDVQEFIRRVETSILHMAEQKDDRSVEAAFRNSFLYSPPFSNGSSVHTVATQTSPLISRSSSFLWISETDLAKQQVHLEADTATCSVNSILSSCSSLEAFSEESLSSQSESDSSSGDDGTTKCSASSLDHLGTDPDVDFFRLLSGDNRIDVSLMKKKLACSDSDECGGATDSALQCSSESETATCGDYPKSGHTTTTQEEEDDDDDDVFDSYSKDSCKPDRHDMERRPTALLGKCPSRLKALGLKSAPTSPVSTPSSEDCSPPASNSAADLPMLYIASKSSSAPILDIQSQRFNSSPKTAAAGSSARQGSFPGCQPPSCTTLPLMDAHANMKVVPPPRSHSAKELTELEAVEACKWLRAAGFPQYAQMFEDMQFPINITAVQKDHYFLDADSIQSLFRRLNALNRCARMRLDNIPRKTDVDDSDEEEQIALSENWTFQRQSRRWSRISVSLDSTAVAANKNNILISSNHVNGQAPTTTSNVVIPCCEDNVVKTSPKMIAEFDVPESPIPMDEDGSGGSASLGSLSASDKMDDSLPSEVRTGSFRRTSSERLRDGAKAFLRRMESLKTRRSKRRNREAVVISGPQLLDTEGMQKRMQNLACKDLTPPSSSTPSPLLTHQRNLSNGHKAAFDDNSSTNSISDNSQTSTPTLQVKSYHWGIHSAVLGDVESGAFSDSECSPPLWHPSRDANSNETKLIEHYIPADETNCVPNGISNNANHINFRTGSFNLGKESSSYREKFLERRRLKHSTAVFPGDAGKRASVYDNVPNNTSNKSCDGTVGNGQISNELSKADLKYSEEKAAKQLICFRDCDSNSKPSTNVDVDSANHRITQNKNKESEESTDSANRSQTQCLFNTNLNCQVNRQITSSKRPWSSICSYGLPLSHLSAAQLMVLRKLSLLRLTALMERYSPSNRSGWSWIMPKFMKRIKAPDYKDKVMFGVPLSVICQRTGQPLPLSIQAAIEFLTQNAMDSVGIFRKSGVRSRIQKLKNMCEASPNSMSYEGQQSYDVADMLKQYFRELPEALLTNKMSETFICIYQYIPEDLRHEALKAAVMLMPDENREVLHKLLSFLYDISLHSQENQMTASNLAVCFAPSLFHMSTPRSTSSSPRRRKTVGVPDQKELNENKAAHECLTHMIKEYKRLFSVPEDTMSFCRISLTDSDDATLEEMGQLSGSLSSECKSFIHNAIESILKEAKEKSKTWVSVMTPENAEIACKKLGDGSPLRQWKVSVEVEAPPIELLTRVLRERHIWDDQITKSRVICRLDNHSEIYQYVSGGMFPLPSRDYCVLRSWRTDLPKGACVLVETSVNHVDAPLPINEVRGFVYLSQYLIEPCGSGKSRITHISRIDTKGRSPEWYNKIYGHISALHLLRIGDSFRHSTEGPESKV